MILKRATERNATDAKGRAGIQAERQMAFYLERYFGDAPDVFVINDLRIEEENGDATQIDHLVIDQCGFHIIESKSVTSCVKVTELDAWEREWDGRWEGMPSPLLQAKRQQDFLMKYLDRRASHLIRMRLPFMEFNYGKLRWEHWVAISDKGRIVQKVQVPHQTLLKADQIPECISDILNQDKQALKISSVFSSKPIKEALYVPFHVDIEALKRLAKWIVVQHRPLGKDEIRIDRVDPLEVREVMVPGKHVADDRPESKHCWKCDSRRLEIRHKHSHYFHCLDCGANTSIVFRCQSNACKPTLHEIDGGIFLRRCVPCGTERPYYRNPQ